MAEQSLPDEGVQNSSDSRNDESLLDKDNQESADEQRQDTDSGEQVSSDSDSGSSSKSIKDDDKDEQSSDDDKALSNFAKSRGYDFSELTDREKKLLRDSYENQKAFRQESQKKSDELRAATEEINDPRQVEDDDNLTDQEKREFRRDLEIAQMRSDIRARNFFDDNPEAKEYEPEMSQVILEKKEKYGPGAARLFAQDLNEVYILAQARRGSNDSEVAREAGRREERELLRKRQEGSADTAHSTQASTPTPKVTKEWLQSEDYDPSNPEHRAMVDEALADGSL